MHTPASSEMRDRVTCNFARSRTLPRVIMVLVHCRSGNPQLKLGSSLFPAPHCSAIHKTHHPTTTRTTRPPTKVGTTTAVPTDYHDGTGVKYGCIRLTKRHGDPPGQQEGQTHTEKGQRAEDSLEREQWSSSSTQNGHSLFVNEALRNAESLELILPWVGDIGGESKVQTAEMIEILEQGISLALAQARKASKVCTMLGTYLH